MRFQTISFQKLLSSDLIQLFFFCEELFLSLNMIRIFYDRVRRTCRNTLWFIVETNTFGAFFRCDIGVFAAESGVFSAIERIGIVGSKNSVIRTFYFTSVA